VVFITHDIDETAYLADRVVVLSSSPRVVCQIVDVSPPRPSSRSRPRRRSASPGCGSTFSRW
jgi:ABC-type nitrate/sulfonate/bicarbonate transport system ATPase subunit